MSNAYTMQVNVNWTALITSLLFVALDAENKFYHTVINYLVFGPGWAGPSHSFFIGGWAGLDSARYRLSLARLSFIAHAHLYSTHQLYTRIFCFELNMT